MEIRVECVGFDRQRIPAPRNSVVPRCASDAWTDIINDTLARFHPTVKDMESLKKWYQVKPKRELEILALAEYKCRIPDSAAGQHPSVLREDDEDEEFREYMTQFKGCGQ